MDWWKIEGTQTIIGDDPLDALGAAVRDTLAGGIAQSSIADRLSPNGRHCCWGPSVPRNQRTVLWLTQPSRG